MFYTIEEAAIIGGFLELYLERDSVDPAVRERHRRFRQGLMRGTLERWNGPIMNGRLRCWASCAPNGGQSMKTIGRWRMPC